MTTILRVLDISNNNGNVDMKKIAADGVSGVMIKCTEGTSFIDPLFKENWDAAGTLGLFRGAYHFMHMHEDPLPQARFFLANLPELKPGDAVSPDIEWPPDYGGDLSAQTLSWIEDVGKAVGYAPMPYSDVGYIEAHLHAIGLGVYPLWLASWGTFLPPSVGPWRSIALWQDSARRTVPGVSGFVDESLIARDEAGLRELGKPGAVPLPPHILPTGPEYIVTTAHYLRVLPKVAAPHAEAVIAKKGDHVTAAHPPAGMPEWTTNWRYVRSATGGHGYADAANLKLP